MPSESAEQPYSRLNGFLEGLRVVDLSSNVPGPTTTLALADMGARVLKVEAPSGDPLRRAGPVDAQGRSIFFDAMNSGKAVISLDLKSIGDKEAFTRIVEKADILVEGFRPDVMPRLGLGPEELLRINPRLIFCSINGYGSYGPMSDRAGLDSNFLAASGILHANGAHKPIRPSIADGATSIYALAAILGAVIARSRDGRGCHLECALADAPMALQQIALSELGALRAGLRPRPDVMSGDAAYYRLYETKDARRVVLAARDPKFWRTFCQIAGRPDWVDRRDDPFPQISLSEDLQSFFAEMSLSEVEDLFGSTDSCVTAVLDLEEALSWPHHVSRGLVQAADLTVQASFPVIVNGSAPKLRDEIVFDYAADGATQPKRWEDWW